MAGTTPGALKGWGNRHGHKSLGQGEAMNRQPTPAPLASGPRTRVAFGTVLLKEADPEETQATGNEATSEEEQEPAK